MRLLIIILGFFLLSACAGSSTRLTLRSDFTAKNINKSGLIVAGVANLNNKLNFEQRVRYANILHQVFSVLNLFLCVLTVQLNFQAPPTHLLKCPWMQRNSSIGRTTNLK